MTLWCSNACKIHRTSQQQYEKQDFVDLGPAFACRNNLTMLFFTFLYFGLWIIEANWNTKMAELRPKKKKQSQGDMCNITLEVLIQVAKIKRWLGKECSTEMHPLKSCLFKLTRTFFIFYINNTYCAFLDYGTLTILSKMHGLEVC